MRLLTNGITPHIVALAIGGGGAFLGLGLGLPAAALIGSSLSVAAAAMLKIPLALHPRLRDLAFAVIGISLGAGVERESLAQLGAWSVSLALLMASLATTLGCGMCLLHRGFGIDRRTAVLATSPGTMSNAIALAVEGNEDATTILVLQVMRLLVLVAVVPPVASLLDAGSSIAFVESMRLWPLGILVGTALALGLVGSRWGIPAACLLAGMLLSAGAHVAGLVQGPAPDWAVIASFVITGTALGARLTAVTPAQLWKLAGAGLLLVASAVMVSLVFSGLTHALTGIPLAQVWIAYAPGGVEAMAAIGLALGYDPAYVAVHHFARILALVMVIPIILRWAR